MLAPFIQSIINPARQALAWHFYMLASERIYQLDVSILVAPV